MKIVYFSILKEKLGISEESIDFEGDDKSLKEYLCKKYAHVCDIIKVCRFAKNNQYTDEFKNEDVVFVIPPVSGG